MVKKRNNIAPVPLLVSALVLFSLGLCLFLKPQTGMTLILRMARMGLIVLAVMAIAGAATGESRGKLLAYLPGALYAIGCVCLFLFPMFFAAGFWRLFGLWALLNAFLHAVSAVNFWRDGAKGFLRECFDGAFSLIFAVMIIWNPIEHLIGLARLSGIYTMYVSTTFFGDFLASFFKTDLGKTITPSIHLPLPAFLAAFIPRRLLKSINEVVQDKPEQSAHAAHDAPLEVYIHMSEGVIEGFGHVDLCFLGKVYSYGCYDHKSHRLFGLVSDGTLAVCEIEPYMRHCLAFEKKTIIAFGIYLDQKGIDKVQKNLDQMFDNLVEWKCAYDTGDKSAKDPASLLRQAADATFYKYKRGSFKTYFTLGTNCVKLAHNIIGNSGAGILHVSGFVTPGTYYAYLDKLYNLNGTIVTTKNVFAL